MAEAAIQTYSPEQTLDIAREIAKTSGDEFRVKISRAKPGQTYPEHVATLDGASVDHVAHPEPWLARLAGGGRYYLSIFHNSTKSKAIGGVILVNAGGQPREVDVAAIKHPDWQGPPVLVAPLPAPQPEVPFATIDGSPTPGAVGASQSQTRVAPGGGGLSGYREPPESRRDAVREAQLINLERERESLRMRERDMNEERHRNELALLQEKQAAEMARLRAEVVTARPPGDDPMTKLLMLMREEAKERAAQEEARRREDREREDRRLAEERAREERRAAAEAQDRKDREAERARIEQRLAEERKAADERFMGLLMKMTERKEDPLVKALIEKGDKGAEQTARVMESMSAAASGVINMAMGLVHSMQELQSEDEPPMLKFTREIMSGIAKISQASQPTIPPQRLPRHSPPVSAVAPAAPAQRAPQPSTAGAQPPQPRRMRTPAELAREAENAHLTSPPTPAGPNAPPMFDGDPNQGAPSATRLQQVIAAIKAKDEIPFVASFFLNNLEEPSVAKAIQEGQGSPVMAFAPYLMGWLEESEENQQYVRDLVITVFKMGEQRGMFPPGSTEQAIQQAPSMFSRGEAEEEEEVELAGNSFVTVEPAEVQMQPEE